MTIISYSVNQTLHIGRKISKELVKGDIICLFGQLGSGKTVLTKGIASGLGIEKDRIISPTFVLIRQYNQAKIPLYHFDLYRLKSPMDILDLGYEEFFYNEAVTVIEWADRLKYVLPKEYLKIELSIKTEGQRLIEFNAFGQRYRELTKKIYEDIRH
ncbi:MAG: tRNA (adenosine(37)-N6)-threonylcarbamoyltransferase complex ATPase subunit type 1 TsaE [Candidatus Omnitrophica bacterium]|nr:tRNA (adenosine(37)-N6)-threonylcarbamoyltransferase complex ATPase subunit type 1 TsaE [Candidatus Omnitrophota bacterium]